MEHGIFLKGTILAVVFLSIVGICNASANIALSKPTSQSTYLGTSNKYDSSKAVDGDKSESGNLFHTGSAENNWWKVHLMDLYKIQKVVIFNRVDCCGYRLRGYQVGIYKSGVPVYTYDHEAPSESPGDTVIINVPEIVGDEVKVSIPGRKEYMNFREVEVEGTFYADGVTTRNVALNSNITSEASVYDYYNDKYDSKKAVDGNKLITAPLFRSGYLLDNYLKVHLWNVHEIERVIIYNQRNYMQFRLRGFQVSIYKAGLSTFTYAHENPEESPGSYIIIDVPKGIVGDEVKLSLPERKGYLQIIELEVYGKLSSNYTVISSTNLAQSKPTRQSSLYSYSNYDSSFAVDGDKSYKAVRSITNDGYNSWWSVHLLNLCNIQRVVIYNFNNAPVYMERLKGFHVDIYKAGVSVFTYEDKGTSPVGSVIVVDTPSGLVGDEVKVSIPGKKEHLTLREVEVYGDVSSDSYEFTNVALSKRTTHSSQLKGYESSNAVDGNKAKDAVIFNSGANDNNWLMVHLGELHLIRSVVVYNVVGSSQTRLKGYHVEIFKSGVHVFTYFHREPDKWPGSILVIDVPIGVTGDAVKLSIPGRRDIMHLREIEIYGKISSNSDPVIERPLFPVFLGTEYVIQKGIQSDGTTVMSFDNGDYVTYPLVNFGTSGTTKSIRFTYSKENVRGRVEVRLGGYSGTLIGTFNPMNSHGVEHATANLAVDLVTGVHDLTFVAKDVTDVMFLESFELSKTAVFEFTTDYKIDDNNGKDVQCTYDVVKAAYNDKMFQRYYKDLYDSVEESFYDHLGVGNETAAEKAVSSLCKYAQEHRREVPLEALADSQFIELFYSGRGSWNEETQTNLYPSDGTTPAQILRKDAYKVPQYKDISERQVFKMPKLPQFDPDKCASHAAQCCWPRDRQANDNNGNCATPYDENCVDKDVADNTDLCYNELDKANYTNGIDANGFSIYDQEGPVHCHGFAWSTGEQEITTRYKANALFFVSMYDHMYQRGYVENIPGSPMCGCVEDMPIVSRSDCTQTNVKEYYTFYKHDDQPGFKGVLEGLNLQYQACQGANNQNNDLTAFVQQLVNDEKLSTNEQDIFKKRVVGSNQCRSATDKLLNRVGLKKGYNFDESKWTYIVGEGFKDKQPMLNDRLINEMIGDQEFPIIRRLCLSCSESHKDIYYRRLKPMPEEFDLLNLLMSNWTNSSNVLNEDFALYSTNYDAYFDTNRWKFCNYNAEGIGFPRDCGPTSQAQYEWNSYVKSGGRAQKHAFFLQVNPDFKSDLKYKNVAKGKPTLQATQLQSGSSIVYDASVTVDGDKADNAPFYHSALLQNNWIRVYLNGYYTIGRIVIFNRRDCCQERLKGYQIDVYKSGVSVFTYKDETPDVSPGSIIGVDIPEGIVGDEVKLSIPGRRGYLHIRELEVYGEFFGDSAELTNVALRKPTLHSSSYGSAGKYVSSNAVDGRKSFTATFFHSELFLNNWWMVSLQGLYTIRRIVIYNRFDCCLERLKGYQIEIYKSGESIYTYNDETPTITPGHIVVVNIPAEIIGDEVKLSLPGRKDYINIREVEVYGEFYGKVADLQNVALSKPTMQSSIYGNLNSYDSSKAVDGDKSEGARLFITSRMVNNWWRVFLQNRYTISRIIIYNRFDGYAERLNKYQIDIFSAGDPVYSYNHNETYTPMQTVVINIPKGIVGDDVKLSLPKTNEYINIREVEVYGEYYGSAAEVTNIALNKPTSSSSTYSSGYDSSKAVDGDKSYTATLFHSKLEENGWWKVSLGNIEPIKRIGIFNRYTCCADRLKGYQVGIYKSGNATFIYNDTNPSYPGHDILIDIPGEVYGDEVKLSLPNTKNYINIREVEVYKVSYAPTASPTRAPQASPTRAPTPSNTTLAPTQDTSRSQCDGLDKATCSSINTCKYSKKKKLKGCAARKEHDCGQHLDQESCDGMTDGVCQWNKDTCSHTCNLIKKAKQCKKMMTATTNEKMCIATKTKNPCFGCHAKSKC